MLGAVGRLVGRDAERARLAQLVADVRAGRGGALVITAPAGRGKTALLDDLRGAHEELRVVRAAAIASESDLPFAALLTVLRPLLEHLADVPAVQRGALERALALGPGGPGERFAVGAATLSLLAAASAREPLLVVIDDLHWVDEPSREALLFAARRLGDEAVGVVLAGRAPAPDGLEALELGPLSADDARTVVSHLTDNRLDAEAARSIVAAGGGEPLLLEELVAGLTPGQRTGLEHLVGPPPPGTDAERLLAERVAALDTRARLALLLLAAGESEEPEAITQALAALGMDRGDLRRAEDAGLVQLDGAQVRMRHPLVRSVAYHGADPGQRRRAHAALAAAAGVHERTRPWHLAAAADGPDAAVAQALEAAADDARRRGGHASAARALRRAADLTPDREARARRLLAAADDLEHAGRLDEVARLLGEAEALTEDRTVLASIQGVRASLLLRAGQAQQARPLLLVQAEALTATAPQDASRFHLQAAFASMMLGEVHAWQRHARDGLHVAPPGSSNRRAAMSLLGAALAADGRSEDALPLAAEVEALFGDEPVGGAVEVHGLLALGLACAEHWDVAQRLLGRLVQDARTLGSGASLPFLLGVQALVDGRRGRWTAALAACDEALELYDGWDLHGPLGTGALVSAWRGDAERCRRDARRTMDLPGPPRRRALPLHALGALALGRGDVQEAAEHLAEAEEVHRATGFREPGTRHWVPDLVEALVRLERREEAEAELARWVQDGRRTGRPFVLATAARCRGLLAAEDFDAAFGEAHELHRRCLMPFEAARTRFLHGERLRRERRPTDARAPLREALEAFERLGAGDWARRARSELRATGGMVPAARRPELGELTSHEVQVALMVAEGRTNKEVAAALFLSPKTIEHHLSAIFRKLGLRRRTELARVFAAELGDRTG